MKNNTQIPPVREELARFVDAEYLATKYNVTSRYILQLASEGRIPCIRLGRKCVRFDESAVAAALGGSHHNEQSL